MIAGLIDVALEPVAAAIGFPVDRIKFVGCILLSYPLGLMFRKIPSIEQRHMWSIGIGALMILMCFDFAGLFHFLAGPLLVYGCLNFIPSKHAPKVGFGIMMGYLSALHIHRMFTDYMGYTMDITSLVMVTVIKVTSFACNIRDGKLMNNPDQLTPAWQKYAVTSMPSILEFLSFLFFFPTFLAGPAFHFSTYKQFIEGTLYKDAKHNPTGREPSPFLPALFTFGEAIICLVVYVYFRSFPTKALFLVGGLDQYNIVVRMIYLLFACVGVRCQYYFAWKLSEGAGILSGLGFNGYDEAGTPLFDRLCNVYITKVEFAGSVRDLTIYWNYATGEWLKNYVYTRQAESIHARVPTSAMYLTNTVSAFWHGFYPGYYIAFAKASFEIDIFRQLRGRFRPLFTKTSDQKKEEGIYPAKYLYDVVGWGLQSASFNFGMAFFIGLSWENALIFLGNFYYLPIIAPLVIYGALATLPKPRSKKE